MEDGARALEPLRRIARLWDDAVRVPVLGRVGLDALLGLIPGVGDLAGGVVAAYALTVAARLRAPAPLLGRMLLNIGLDTLIGAVPLLGDLFDVGWKSNSRNVRLLERWLEEPDRARRRSTLVLVGTALAFIAIVVAAVWLVAVIVGWVIGVCCGA